jgi:hypothetical protein
MLYLFTVIAPALMVGNPGEDWANSHGMPGQS